MPQGVADSLFLAVAVDSSLVLAYLLRSKNFAFAKVFCDKTNYQTHVRGRPWKRDDHFLFSEPPGLLREDRYLAIHKT